MEDHLPGLLWIEDMLQVFHGANTSYWSFMERWPLIGLLGREEFLQVFYAPYRSPIEIIYFKCLLCTEFFLQAFFEQITSSRSSMDRTPLTVPLTGHQWKKPLAGLLWRKYLLLLFYGERTS